LSKLILIVWLAVCAPAFACHVGKPVDTPLGRLVSAEGKAKIQTDDGMVTAKDPETLCLVTFTGKSEIPHASAGARADYFLMVDQGTGKSFTVLYAGSPERDGSLSARAWKMTGQMTFQGGQPKFSGTASVPSRTVVLIYRIPMSARRLVLRHGGQTYSISGLPGRAGGAGKAA